MDLIEELNKQIQSAVQDSKETPEQQVKIAEKVAIELLNSIDFKDESNKSQAKEYIKHVLTDFIGKNETISPLQAKTVHCMIAKILLSELNLDDVKVNYSNRTESSNGGYYYAFYSHSDRSINFFNENVCNRNSWLLPYCKNVEASTRSRLAHFAYEVFVVGHEIQHAVQFEAINKSAKTPETLTVDDYIISKQDVARSLSMSKKDDTNKYYKKGLDVDRLYHDNHDQFYYEIDADLQGYKRALPLLKELSETAYKIAISDKDAGYEKTGLKFLSKIEEKQFQLGHYSDITWEHNTNPDNVKVAANHKASMIIDYILPKLNNKQAYLQKYPALQFNYNSDGSKKTLDQVDAEFIEKKRNLPKDATNEQKLNLQKLHNAVIESDPVLSLEFCLRDISNMLWYTQQMVQDASGFKIYDAYQILEKTKQRARKIITYSENAQANIIDKIIKKYEKKIFGSFKGNTQEEANFLRAKKDAIADISICLLHNKEVKETLVKEAMKKPKTTKKHIQRSQALEIINNIFPNFTPTLFTRPAIIGKGYIEIESDSHNVNELMMLMEAYNQYEKMALNLPISVREKEDFVSPYRLLSAIESIYDFRPTPEQQQQFKETFDKGEIEVVKNKYQIEREQAKETLKNLFPDFTPNPQIVSGTLNSGIHISDNVNERLMLIKAYQEYLNFISELPISVRKEKDFIPAHKLFYAIETIYDFRPTPEQQQQFKEAFEKGEIEVVKNKYQIEAAKEEEMKKKEQMKEKSRGNYTQEEVDRVTGQTFSWNSSNVGSKGENASGSENGAENQASPTDATSGGAPGMQQSQRQAAAARSRKPIKNQDSMLQEGQEEDEQRRQECADQELENAIKNLRRQREEYERRMEELDRRAKEINDYYDQLSYEEREKANAEVEDKLNKIFIERQKLRHEEYARQDEFIRLYGRLPANYIQEQQYRRGGFGMSR